MLLEREREREVGIEGETPFVRPAALTYNDEHLWLFGGRGDLQK